MDPGLSKKVWFGPRSNSFELSSSRSTVCMIAKTESAFYDYFSYTAAINENFFLAYLSTKCLRGAFRIIRCPSSVSSVNNFFKHQLLLKRWANLNQTWEECSLGGPL